MDSPAHETARRLPTLERHIGLTRAVARAAAVAEEDGRDKGEAGPGHRFVVVCQPWE